MVHFHSIFKKLQNCFGATAVGQSAHVGGPRLLAVVEGRHDMEFLKRISAILHAANVSVPGLAALERRGELVFVPAGGDDFRPWMTRLSSLGCAEFHLFDRELPPVSARRQQYASVINLRPRCRAFVTGFRSLENYLHPAVIQEVRGYKLTYSGHDDVALLAAQAESALHHDDVAWDVLSRRARRRLRDRAKAWLNTEAVERMTSERLAEQDPAGDVLSWLSAIAELLGGVG